MKITITGASGFVGLNLQDYLKGSYEIETLKVRFIADQEFRFETNAIVHLAGKAHDLKEVSKPSDYYKANFELTKQLFDCFLKSEASTFIFMSTVKACADKVDGILIEDYSSNPITHYGISKFKAEQYILGSKLPDDKKVYILRPCMIHGPGNKGNLNLLYQVVNKGFPWPLGAFNNQRSFLSVENLCFIIKELLQNKNIPTGIYQLGDDDAISTNELIETIGTSLGKKTKILKIPTWIITKIANFGNHVPILLNAERLQKLTESYVISNEKIKKVMQKELPVTTKDGLIKTIKSFEKH